MNQDINNFNQQGNNQMLNNPNQQNSQNMNNEYYHNKHISQASNSGQSMFNNSLKNNNIYQQPINPNNISYNNETNNQKQNKFKIIGIVAVILISLSIGIMLFSGDNFSSSGNGYTVEYGEILKVNELEGYYNFEMEVLSVEKNYLIDEVFHSGECLAMKVKIKNNSDEDLSIVPLMMKFNLLDSSNNEISSLNITMSSTMTNALEEIPSGQEASGYFYFFDVTDDGETTNIKNNNIAKLEVEIMKHMEKEDGVISGDYEQYYIKLK